AVFGLTPGPTPPFAAPAMAWLRCSVSPQNAWSPNVSKRKVCLPSATSALIGEPDPLLWLSSLNVDRAATADGSPVVAATSNDAANAPAAATATAMPTLFLRPMPCHLDRSNANQTGR